MASGRLRRRLGAAHRNQLACAVAGGPSFDTVSLVEPRSGRHFLSSQQASRVFWISDNCSSHRGEKAATRLRAQWPTPTLVHTPNHRSWLNQIEIYFSVVQPKVVTPNGFTSLRELEDRLLAFQVRYEQTAKPFQWTFTRDDLVALLAKLKAKELGRAA